jgi:sugar transferase EpsL
MGLTAKRVVDVGLAGFVLAVTAPIWLVLGCAVLLTMGRPVLFRQQRAGRDARPIRVVKFRTMSAEVDATGALLPDGDRLTRVGRWLRRTSLDELPQFLSVLSGDMSLVGPRPLPMAYVDRYSPRQRRRLEVDPGLTGWAQVNGRNSVSWPERLELDVWYVEHRSLWLDLCIMVRTVGVVVSGSGVSADGEATMAEFTGTE